MPIEGKLSNLKKESEEREARVQKERLAGLIQKLVSLEFVTNEITGFDFQNQPIISFLDIIFAGALANRASDIHLEPELEKIRLRYRVDGLLYDISRFPLEWYKLLLSRIKYQANLKINITDRPQDGRFSIHLPDKDVELRVSVIPSEYGETAVIRVLDPETINLQLADLGLRADDLAVVEEELMAPNGMILNTGPTGSGKTTTLYTFLKKKQTSEIKIITIEDPIEYHLAGIEQTQVSSEGEYTFANGLRSIMRQDPDVILVGEIRDKETAEIAIQAALTGHLVFSTVHANEAAGAVPRLLDLGVKPVSIGPALNMIMAQRLVRVLCSDCKKSKEVSPELKTKLEALFTLLPDRVNKEEYVQIQLFEPQGCERCNQLGYRGRIGIFELLRVNEKIESLIEKQASETEINQFALQNGMVTMQQDGILKAMRGITSLEEVEAATGKLKV